MHPPLWRRLMFFFFLLVGGGVTAYLLLTAEGIKYDVKTSDLVPTSSIYIETIPKGAAVTLDEANVSTTALKKLTEGTHTLVWRYDNMMNRSATIKITPPQSYVLPPLRLLPKKPTLRALTENANLICQGSKNILVWTSQKKPNELRFSLINHGNELGTFIYKAVSAITDCQLSPDEKLAAIKNSGSWLIINIPNGSIASPLTTTFGSWLNEKYFWDKNKKLYLFDDKKPLLVTLIPASKVVALDQKIYTINQDLNLNALSLQIKNQPTLPWSTLAPVPTNIKIKDYKFFDAYLLIYAVTNDAPWLYLLDPGNGQIKYSYVGHDIFWHHGFKRWFIRFGKNLQQIKNLGDKPTPSITLAQAENPLPDERSSLIYYLEDNKIIARETNGLWEDKIIVATFPDKIVHFWLGPEQQIILWLNDGLASRLISLDLLP